MKIIEVNSDVKVIEEVITKLHDLKKENISRMFTLERNFTKDRKQFEDRKANLISEKDKELRKEDFVYEAVNLSKAEYNKVKTYLWSSFAIGISLLILNFYNNGINFSFFVKFLLVISLLSYFMAKKMSEHIDSISLINKYNACVIKPPFFYKWFGKSNLHEISLKLSAKHLSNTKEKYDKLIYTAETELNLKIKELNEKKKNETENLNNDLKESIHSSINEINSAMGRLGKVAQTCSSRNNLIGDLKDINSKQNVFSQQYYFNPSKFL